MRILRSTAGDPFLAVGEAPRALRRIARAYLWAMAGLHARAEPALSTALRELEELPGGERAHASALALAGLAARACCRWPEADALLARAGEALLVQGERGLASVCVALHGEALCCTGEIARAAGVVGAWSARERDVPALAHAALQIARGNVEEGGELASALAREAASPPLLRTWAELLLAESLLDQDRSGEARPALEVLVARLEQGQAFDEAYVRALCLLARAAVESLWSLAGPATRPGLGPARTILRKAERCSLHFARYRAQLHALRAQLCALERPGADDGAFEEAMTSLERCGARLDRARAAARQAALHLERAHQATQPLLLGARDLLSQAGAETRSRSLIRASALLPPPNRRLELRVEERAADLAQANRALAQSLAELESTRLRLMEAEKEAVEKELRVARMIQESILPGREPIRRPGLTFTGYLEATSQVGGDLWTYLSMADFSTLLLVGDATGHGLGAGMMTTVVKACCETLVRQMRAMDVQTLLRILSEVIHASARGALAVTAFACLVDPRSRTLTYASAESPGAYLIEAGGGLPRLVPLLASGNRLGEGGTPAPHEVQRRPYGTGDRLVLYTDGLVECADPDRQQLRDRSFRRSLIATAPLPLVEQRDALVADFARFHGGEQHDDDVTLVLAELE